MMSLKLVWGFWGRGGVAIFVRSIANILPNSTVVIKFTCITALSFEHGCVTFHVAASASPWQRDKALHANMQVC